MTDVKIEQSDALKIYDALNQADDFFWHRDRMNARVHLATEVRASPLTSSVSSALARLNAILVDAGMLPTTDLRKAAGG